MEALNGVVSNSSSFYYTHIQKTSKNPSFYHSKACFRNQNRVPNFKKLVSRVGNYSFDDEGHLAYYSTIFCGEKKGNNNKKWGGISTKKRMKLLKGLVNDLSTFSDLGFGLDLDCDNQVTPDKSKAISQAAEILLAQLKHLRSEEEETKKKVKEDEMQKCKSQECESESSSSSSESSDSECDEVIDMKCMKNKMVVQPVETKESTLPTTFPEQSMGVQLPENSEQCCNMILEMTLNKDAGIEVLGSETPAMNLSKVGNREEKKIEVCMGGKCKKLGSPALIEEFQKVMGEEGVVVGCKCLGKCKSAPNVRVSNANVADNIGDDSLRTPSNAICVGVGLEDVELIVANYFGKVSKDQLSVAIAGLQS